MISIRRIRPGEADLFKQIRLAALLDSPSAFGSTYESAQQRSAESWQRQADSTAQGSDRATFLAFADDALDRPIGIMALYRNEDGVAATILEAVCVWAGRNDFDTIVAGVASGNSRVLSFYEKQGFRQTSSVAPGESDGQKLVKSIEPSV